MITIGTVFVSCVTVYIAVRNNSRQVGSQIFLAYSSRVREIRSSLSEQHVPHHVLLDILYSIYEFYALRKTGLVRFSMWRIWEQDIVRLLNSDRFLGEWKELRTHFDVHPDFVTWVESQQRWNALDSAP
jgi:hypothetical protein